MIKVACVINLQDSQAQLSVCKTSEVWMSFVGYTHVGFPDLILYFIYSIC